MRTSDRIVTEADGVTKLSRQPVPDTVAKRTGMITAKGMKLFAVIDQGIGTHHARLADFRGTGHLDIASRPLHGPDKWKIFVWSNLAGGPPP